MNKIINYIKLIISFTLFFIISPVELALINTLKISSQQGQIILSITIKIITTIIISTIYYKDLIKEFKTFKENFKKNYEKNLYIYLFGLIGMIITNIIIKNIIGALPNNEAYIRTLFKTHPIYVLISTTLISPVLEELLFRKSFRPIIKNNTLYITLTSLFFGYMHMQGELITYLYIIPYSLVGASFSYMDVKNNSTFPSIFFHIIHNSLTILSLII